MTRRRPLLLAAAGVFAVLAVTTTATTYALFSDFDSATGDAAAATVALGTPGAQPPALTYPAMQQVGDVRDGLLTVDYQGTVPADVTVALEPGAVPGLCVAGGQNAPGVTVLVGIAGAGEVEYCSLLGGPGLTIAEDVAPGTPVTATITLRLTQNTGATRLAAVDGLVVRASGGFSDTVRGTVAAAVDPVVLSPQEQQLAAESTAAPAALAAVLAAPSAREAVLPLDPELVPVECREAGMTFRLDQVVQLVPGDRPWTADDVRAVPAEPLLVFGTDGDDDITGSTAADCVVGGDGADRISGADGDDVLVGGPGADLLDGGPGADRLFGDAGPDDLIGGPGADRLDGGPDRAACDAGVDDTDVRCAAPAVVPTAPTSPVAPPAPAPAPEGPPPSDPGPPPVPEAPAGEPPAPEPASPEGRGTASTAPSSPDPVAEPVPDGAT